MSNYTKEEEQFIIDNYDTMRLTDIAKHLNRTVKSIDWKCNKLKIPRTKNKTGQQLIQDIKNKGIKFLEPYKGSQVNNKFECPNCKQPWYTLPSRILSQDLTQCHKCSYKSGGRKRRKGSKYITGSYINKLKTNAVKRNHEFAIEAEEVESVLIRQDFKCALTGEEIACPYGDEKRTLSVDQIIPGNGYTIDNIQCVLIEINRMKLDLSQEDFIKWCTIIADYQDSQVVQ